MRGGYANLLCILPILSDEREWCPNSPSSVSLLGAARADPIVRVIASPSPIHRLCRRLSTPPGVHIAARMAAARPSSLSSVLPLRFFLSSGAAANVKASSVGGWLGRSCVGVGRSVGKSSGSGRRWPDLVANELACPRLPAAPWLGHAWWSRGWRSGLPGCSPRAPPLSGYI